MQNQQVTKGNQKYYVSGCVDNGIDIETVARLAVAERRVAELTAVVEQRNAECDRLIIEKGLLRIKSAPGKPVGYTDSEELSKPVADLYMAMWNRPLVDVDNIPLYVTPPASIPAPEVAYDLSQPGSEATVITHYHEPEDWVLVPTKPTTKQWAAGLHAMNNGIDKVTLLYKAMIDAAPAPAPGGE